MRLWACALRRTMLWACALSRPILLPSYWQSSHRFMLCLTSLAAWQMLHPRHTPANGLWSCCLRPQRLLHQQRKWFSYQVHAWLGQQGAACYCSLSSFVPNRLLVACLGKQSPVQHATTLLPHAIATPCDCCSMRWNSFTVGLMNGRRSKLNLMHVFAGCAARCGAAIIPSQTTLWLRKAALCHQPLQCHND